MLRGVRNVSRNGPYLIWAIMIPRCKPSMMTHVSYMPLRRLRLEGLEFKASPCMEGDPLSKKEASKQGPGCSYEAVPRGLTVLRICPACSRRYEKQNSFGPRQLGYVEKIV